VLLLSACSNRPKLPDESADPTANDMIETVWVDPQIVLSDTLMTLIKADRIDTLLLAPGEITGKRGASIEIAVTEPLCNVDIRLLDAAGQQIRPLVYRPLARGFYRLTFNYRRLNFLPLMPGTYSLTADYCGQSKTSVFLVE
ncbi:MAG: hypothetical protein KKA42_14300, partial [candidate division Zixibacteria bacterium]|nr:hypothetical protein [candidate division Zixibacteria bacterium]